MTANGVSRFENLCAQGFVSMAAIIWTNEVVQQFTARFDLNPCMNTWSAWGAACRLKHVMLELLGVALAYMPITWITSKMFALERFGYCTWCCLGPPSSQLLFIRVYLLLPVLAGCCQAVVLSTALSLWTEFNAALLRYFRSQLLGDFFFCTTFSTNVTNTACS